MPATRTPARRTRLLVEQLDDRSVPAVINWTGGGGDLNWGNAANWSGGVLPGVADDAVISAATAGPVGISQPVWVKSVTTSSAGLSVVNGSLVLDADSAVGGPLTVGWGGVVVSPGRLAVGGTLTQTENSILTGAGTVSVAGLTRWTGGTMSGPGTTQANGGLELGAADGVSHTVELAGRTLVNVGSGRWLGTGQWDVVGDATFRNAAGSTFTIFGAVAMKRDAATGVGGRIDNLGQIIAAPPATGSVSLDATITSPGNLRVSRGTLFVRASNTLNGTVTVNTGGTLNLGDNFGYTSQVFGSKAIVTGGGAVRFGSGVAARFLAGSTYTVSGKTTVDTGGNTSAGVQFRPGSTVSGLGAVEMASGMLDLSTGVNVTVPSFTQSGGNLLGTDSLTITGQTTWTGGAMSGPATTTAAGGLTLGASGDDRNGQYLFGRTLVNQGAATHAGGGGLVLAAGGTFTNAAGATFTQTAPRRVDAYLGGSGSEPGRFVNLGQFVVVPGAGTTAEMNAVFSNAGSVEVQSGTWKLWGSGGSTGTITVNGGAAMQRNRFFSGTVGGAGTVTQFDGWNLNVGQVGGGAVSVTGGQWEVTGTVTATSLTMTDGVLTVRGTLVVNGPITWTGGYIGGPGTVVANGVTTFGHATNASTVNLDGVTLVNNGTLAVKPNTSLNQSFASTIRNTSVIDIQGNVTWATDGTGGLVNAGTLKKSAGSGTANVYYVDLTNTGAVRADAGTLNLNGGGVGGGSYTAAAGATLQLAHGFTAFDRGATVGGPGTVAFQWGYWGCEFLAGSAVDSTGVLQVERGLTFDPGSSVRSLSRLNVPAGGVYFGTGAGLTVGALNLSGSGRLTGPDVIDVTGVTTWTGGTMGGTGTTNARGGLQLGATTGTESLYLDGRTLVNVAGGVWAGNHTVYATSGGRFVNTGTFDITGGAYWNGDTGSTVRNAGTFTKTTGAATTMNVTLAQFISTGTAVVGAGAELRVPRGWLVTGGRATVSGLVTGGVSVYGGTLGGSGIVRGTLWNAGRVEAGGATPGKLTVDGDYTQTAAGTLAIDLLGVNVGEYDSLAVTGTATTGGTLEVNKPADFAPPVGSTFRVLTYARRAAGPAFARRVGFGLPNGTTLLTSTFSTYMNLVVR